MRFLNEDEIIDTMVGSDRAETEALFDGALDAIEAALRARRILYGGNRRRRRGGVAADMGGAFDRASCTAALSFAGQVVDLLAAHRARLPINKTQERRTTVTREELIEMISLEAEEANGGTPVKPQPALILPYLAVTRKERIARLFSRGRMLIKAGLDASKAAQAWALIAFEEGAIVDAGPDPHVICRAVRLLQRIMTAGQATPKAKQDDKDTRMTLDELRELILREEAEERAVELAESSGSPKA